MTDAQTSGIAPGPPEEQVGSLHREVWLMSWDLQLAGMGLSEAEIKRERWQDEQGLPERDVGLAVRWNVSWAEKA